MGAFSQALRKSFAQIQLVTIGSSAGGIEALKFILSRLQPPFPVPIVVVQHIGQSPAMTLPEFYKNFCSLPVEEIEDKSPVNAGTIYFAPSGYHALIESDRTFALSIDAPVSYSRPSVDVLMESVAHVYGSHAMGIILTGANQDGAEGLKAIVRRGGIGIVQDPATAAFSAMPEAARMQSPSAAVLTIPQITELLSEMRVTENGKEV